jgi:hypothetical protein
MKNKNLVQNQKPTCKRNYNRPEITGIKLDNEISMVMASANPFNDPDSSIQPDLNPFKMLKF